METNKLKNSICLITGGAGFIGSAMCKRLLELNAKVVCFDNLSTGILENIKDLKVIFIKGDVNNYKKIEKVFKKYKIDYVLHYAAMVGVKRTLENPEDWIKKANLQAGSFSTVKDDKPIIKNKEEILKGFKPIW